MESIQRTYRYEDNDQGNIKAEKDENGSEPVASPTVNDEREHLSVDFLEALHDYNLHLFEDGQDTGTRKQKGQRTCRRITGTERHHHRGKLQRYSCLKWQKIQNLQQKLPLNR